MQEISIETCQKKKKKKREYQKNRYKFMEKNKREILKQYQKNYYNSKRIKKRNIFLFSHNINMSEKTLKFSDVEVNKKISYF